MSFTITRGGSSVVLPNPEHGNLDGLRRLQVSAESIGGVFYVYDRGASVQEIVATFALRNVSQRDALRSFFDSTAQAMKNTVDLAFTDWRPAAFGGTGGVINLTGWRFASPALEWTERRNGLFAVTCVWRSN